MSTKLNFGRDIQGYNAYAPPPAADKYSAVLAAGGNATITLPTNSPYWIISFSFQAGSDVWVAYNGTAAAPAGATFATTTSELLPGSRILQSTNTTSSGTVATTINMLNNGTGTADIGVVLYASP